MLGTLVTAVPLVVTLAAAFYFIRRSFQCQPTQEGFTERRQGWRGGPDSGYNSGCQQGRARTTRRRRRHPEDQTERSHGGKRLHQSEIIEDLNNECAVCFENEGNIELSPCHHTNVCIDCVNKIITDLDRGCPFCRTYIQAYSIVAT